MRVYFFNYLFYMLGESLVVVFRVETEQQLPPCGCRTTCKQWAYPIILFGVLWCFAPDCLCAISDGGRDATAKGFAGTIES